MQLYDRVDVLRRIAHEERRDIEIVLAVFQRARDAVGVANVGDVVRVRHGLAELNRLTGLEIGFIPSPLCPCFDLPVCSQLQI